MKRLSGSSNPTSLKEISKNKISLTVSELGGVRHFHLESLEIKDMDLPDNALVICTAKSGNTSKRFNLGTVSAYSRKPMSLAGIDESSVLKFRLLVRNENDSSLIASAEDIRPVDVDDQDGESLLPMLAADLGQVVWKLDLDEGLGPTLLFNKKVFPNAAGANNYTPFVALVLPEVMRQILVDLKENASDFDDDGCWRYQWGKMFGDIGISLPTDDEDNNWIEETLMVFSEKFSFADDLKLNLVGRH
jgi:hypothetical protein